MTNQPHTRLKKKQHTKSLVILLVLYTLSIVVESSADITPNDLMNRKYEPLVSRMYSFQSFFGLPISQLFLYAYDSESSTWRIVPFQIDERNDETGAFESGDGLLDGNDDISFMLKSLGDKVPDGLWRPDTDSTRICIEVVDTLRNQKGWVYLFHSTSINDFNFEEYLDYDEQNDKIVSKYYEVGMDPGFGLPTNYTITSANGGNDVDILDRFKVRIVVDSDVGKIFVSEDNIKKQEVLPFFNSKVRYRRNMLFKIEVKVTVIVPITIPLGPYEFPIDFFPYCMQGIFEIPLDFSDAPIDVNPKIKSMRTSNDYGVNSHGMYFHNFFNPDQLSANLIDGSGTNTGLDRSLVVPGINWMMITGTPGTILHNIFVPELGNNQELYFWDNLTGGRMDDGNGKGDTVTRGDSGVLVTGSNITGSFSLILTTYFLPPVDNIALAKGVNSIAATPLEIGELLKENVASPPVVNVSTEQFDIFPPAKIEDLNVVSFSDSNLTVSWTSPGDNGSIGTAQSYDLRYSTQVPDIDLEGWFATATSVSNISAPQPPGNTESVTIPSLDKNSTFYLGIKTSDENGNVSLLSNIATGIALDVELASFYAIANKREVQLFWRTISEDNNLGFEVERRLENTSFEKIAFIPGHGTTNQPHDYSFTDLNVSNGQYFYRLKQIDSNGAFTYSDEVEAILELPTEFVLLQNYPNPFNPETTLEYEVAIDGLVLLTIYNLAGQEMVAIVNEKKAAGRYRVRLNAENWPSGIYFAKLQSTGHVLTRKMLLLE